MDRPLGQRESFRSEVALRKEKKNEDLLPNWIRLSLFFLVIENARLEKLIITVTMEGGGVRSRTE